MSSVDIAGVVVVIPSLNPNDRLIELIKALTKSGFSRIIVVDDGSSSESKHFFDSVRQNSCTVVLTHQENFGKGMAIKTALKYITENMHDSYGVVTADADGQHCVDDIVKCAYALYENKNKLIMGCRAFDDKAIPIRSRLGNKLTSRMIKWLCGISLSDTQTGLRGIPYCHISAFMRVKGERFEYEMNMLLEAKSLGIKLVEIPIKTIYIDENRTSHFNPLKDSLKIYSIFFKFIASSLSSAIVDVSLFTVMTLLLKPVLPDMYILAATVIARVVSSVVNYIINHKTVFKAREGNIKSVIRYYLLCAVQMLCSAALVYCGVSILMINETISKLIVDIALFLISFYIQREWVFKNSENE